MKKITVYLAGKITGDPDYRAKFAAAQEALEAAGYIVLNPAVLPEGAFAWDGYMRICHAMLDECEAICFLPDWIDSNGAQWEYGRAHAKNKSYFFYADFAKRTGGNTPCEVINGVSYYADDYPQDSRRREAKPYDA